MADDNIAADGLSAFRAGQVVELVVVGPAPDHLCTFVSMFGPSAAEVIAEVLRLSLYGPHGLQVFEKTSTREVEFRERVDVGKGFLVAVVGGWPARTLADALQTLRDGST